MTEVHYEEREKLSFELISFCEYVRKVGLKVEIRQKDRIARQAKWQ